MQFCSGLSFFIFPLFLVRREKDRWGNIWCSSSVGLFSLHVLCCCGMTGFYLHLPPPVQCSVVYYGALLPWLNSPVRSLSDDLLPKLEQVHSISAFPLCLVLFSKRSLTNVGLRSILMVCQSSMQVLSTVFLFQGYQCWKTSLISLLIFSLISVPISKEIFLLFFLMVTNPSKGAHNSLNPVTVYFANYRCPVKYAGMASLWPLKDKATCCCFSYCCCFVILSPTIFVPMQTFLYM